MIFLEPTEDSSTEAEPPADCSSHSPAAEAAEAGEGGGVTSESEKKDEDLNPSQVKTEDEVVSDTSEEKEKVEEDKETGAPAVETGVVYVTKYLLSGPGLLTGKCVKKKNCGLVRPQRTFPLCISPEVLSPKPKPKFYLSIVQRVLVL